MKSYPEGWVLFGLFHRIPAISSSNHKAGGRENPPLMRLHNGLIHGQCKAEIISGDYDFFQWAFRAAGNLCPEVLIRHS